MPLRANPYDEQQDFPAPPNAPPVEGGGGAPAANPSPPAFQIVSGQSTPPAANQGGGGGGGGWALPAYPGIRIPGAPTYTPRSFNQPTLDEARNEPGYAFRVGQGQDALERSAAAKGVLRTGGILSDVLQYGQKFAEDEYKNVYDRAFNNYRAQVAQDQAAFAPRFAQWQQQADADKQGQLSRYQADLNHSLQIGAPGPAGYQPSLEELLGPPPQFNPYDYGDQGGGAPPPPAQAPSDPRRRDPRTMFMDEGYY
jgi:hypothetical protein